MRAWEAILRPRSRSQNAELRTDTTHITHISQSIADLTLALGSTLPLVRQTSSRRVTTKQTPSPSLAHDLALVLVLVLYHPEGTGSAGGSASCSAWAHAAGSKGEPHCHSQSQPRGTSPPR